VRAGLAHLQFLPSLMVAARSHSRDIRKLAQVPAHLVPAGS
jgi:hypothetical protein